MINRGYILAALKQGFSDSQIAAGLGVSQSAILQFIDGNDLRNQAAAESKFTKIDDQINTLEEKILQKLDASMKMAVMNPLQWGGLFKIVNGAKRRSLSEGRPILEGGATLVQLTLPERMRVSVQRNQQNEIIEVEGRLLTTLPAGKLVEMANKPKEVTNGISYDPVTKDQIADLL